MLTEPDSDCNVNVPRPVKADRDFERTVKPDLKELLMAPEPRAEELAQTPRKVLRRPFPSLE